MFHDKKNNQLRVLFGTELKVAVEAANVDLTACDFSLAIFTRPASRVEFRKEDLQPIPGTSAFMAVLDTRRLGAGGVLRVELTAHIPDSDCPDALRTEVAECTVQGVSHVAMPGAEGCISLGGAACLTAQGGQWLQLAAWLVTESGVAYRSPVFMEGGVVVLNATQQAAFAAGGVLSVANGAEFTEEVLTFK